MANSILANLGDRLNEILKFHSKQINRNRIYDPNDKNVDLTKIVPPRELSRLLQQIAGSNFGESVFEKFFDLSLGRSGRYKEYEQIYYRIPEAAQALHIYIDSILSPNVGDRDNQIEFDVLDNVRYGASGKSLIKAILDKSGFSTMLPQIIFTTLLYGDAFVELDKTSSGIRYIIHTPKECTLLYDKKTDIELGLIVDTGEETSKLLDMLSDVYPSLYINTPNRTVAIVSNKQYMSNKANAVEVKQIEMQIMELVGDLLKDHGAQYKYLSPNKYVRFSVFYNNLYYPYGTSIYDTIRSVAKQLLLVEAALAIYRATRTPLRTLWSIEVGNTPDAEIPGLINGIMSRIRRQKVVNTENGGATIDSIPDIMSTEEDIWSPSISGNPLLKCDRLEPPSIDSFTNDVEYFKRKMIGALGIPPAYLAEEQGASTRALLTLEDVRFSRTIKKYQVDINNGLQDLVNTCFMIFEKYEFINNITARLPEPKNIEDNIRIQNLSERLSTADSFNKMYPNVPKIWLMKNILGMNEDDIKEMQADITNQSKYSIFNEQLPGFIKGEDDVGGGIGGMSGGMGGSPDLSSGGDMGEDFMNDLDSVSNEASPSSGETEGELDLSNEGNTPEISNLGTEGELSENEITNEEENLIDRL